MRARTGKFVSWDVVMRKSTAVFPDVVFETDARLTLLLAKPSQGKTRGNV